MDTSDLTHPDAAPGVHQIAVPPAARALSTLSRIDYADAFVVDTGPAQDRTPDQWARAIFEEAPGAVRTNLLAGWTAIGLKVGKGRAARSVLGWRVRASGPEFVLLGAESRIGMPGELLVQRRPDALLFATFVQQDNLNARAVWVAVEPRHVRAVRDVLEQARRRCRPTSQTLP